MAYADRMRKTLTGRTGDWLGRNFCPRLLVLAAYGLAILVAYQSSVSLAYLGVKDLWLRMVFSFCIAYFFFTVLTAIAIACFPNLDRNSLMHGASQEIATQQPSGERPDWVEQAAKSTCEAIAREPRGIVALPLLIAVLGVIFLLMHWMAHAPWYLGELMVATGKVSHRSVPEPCKGAWLIEPFRQSIWMGLGLLVHFALLGRLLTSFGIMA